MKQLYFLFLLLGFTATAQVSNSDCDDPIILDDVSDWCSENGAFTNVGAEPSGYGAPACFSNAFNDVWYTFVAGATDVTIFVRGNASIAPGGTMGQPEIALYTADCGGTINELNCASDVGIGNGSVEIYEGGLIPGLTYLIRVQGAGGGEGTFQLCINNFFPPENITSDCPTSAVLCDKSPFVVEAVTGAGSDNTEMSDALCFSNGAPGFNESNSTWFTWICQESGPLEFSLTPLNETDDLDFVVYELPNGIGDCSGKIVRRCMASGENPALYPTPCHGPTGLAEGFTEISMDAGCNDPGDGTFLAPLDMVQGVSYALVVNNFTSTGNSFQIEFGGTGTFRGPEPAFVSDEPDNKVCVGEEIEFTDASIDGTALIESWEWTFGANASMQAASGQGPHTLTYTEPGLKSVVLIIETSLGCRVAEVATFEVVEPVEYDTALTPPDCGGGDNGEIALNVTQGDPPITYEWAGLTDATPTQTGLVEGDYPVTITDGEGCTTEFVVELREPGLALDASVEPVRPPTCTGDTDGQITISATAGTYPYFYDFGSGFQNDSIQTGLAAGTYTVLVQDANGCDDEFEIVVEDPAPLELALDITDISCNGEDDGTGTATALGGHGDYEFVWADTLSGAMVSDLPPGSYQVTVTDRFGCTETEVVEIIEPSAADLQVLGTLDVICFGDRTGEIYATGSGGVPPFEYSVRPNSGFQPDTILSGLPAGIYTVYQRDANGCIVSFPGVEIFQPDEILVDAGPDQVVDLGDEVTLTAIMSPFDPTASYNWLQLSDSLCVADSCRTVNFLPTSSQEYDVEVTDGDGCTAIDRVLVRVVPVREVYIPNAFSPNSDGVNDFFTLFGGPGVREIRELKIFDRWGELIWEGGNFQPNVERLGWNGMFRGKTLNPGVFVYSATVEYIDDRVLTYGGDVALLR